MNPQPLRRSPSNRGRYASAVVTAILLALLAACGGGGDGATVASNTTVRGSADSVPDDKATGSTIKATGSSVPHPGSTVATPGTTAGAPPGASAAATDLTKDLCNLLPLAKVTAASGADLEKAAPTQGTGTLQDVKYRLEGCSYTKDSADNRARVVVLLQEDGTPFGLAEFTQLKSASAALPPSDKFPHAEVPGLGDGAFFTNSRLSNELIVVKGDVVLSLDGEIAEETLGRPALQALATEALAALP